MWCLDGFSAFLSWMMLTLSFSLLCINPSSNIMSLASSKARVRKATPLSNSSLSMSKICVDSPHSGSLSPSSWRCYLWSCYEEYRPWGGIKHFGPSWLNQIISQLCWYCMLHLPSSSWTFGIPSRLQLHPWGSIGRGLWWTLPICSGWMLCDMSPLVWLLLCAHWRLWCTPALFLSFSLGYLCDVFHHLWTFVGCVNC